MRLCPRCHVPLEPAVERSHLGGTLADLTGGAVEVDACPQCAGSFLDRGEAGRVAGAAGLDVFLAVPRASYVDGAKCPGCGTTMAFRDAGGVSLDACPRCGGFWLDRGEVAHLQRSVRSGRLTGAKP